MQNDVICQINLQNNSLLQYSKFECFGCNFGIYKTNERGEQFLRIVLATVDPLKSKACGEDFVIGREINERHF